MDEAITPQNLWQRLLANKYLVGAQLLLAVTIVIDYSLSSNIDHVLGGWFYLLPLSGLVLSILPLLKGWDFYQHKFVVLGLSHLVVGSFLLLLTDVFGPYFQILILLLFTGIYWLGTSGLLFGLTFQFLILLLGAWYQYGSLTEDLIYVMLIHMAVLSSLGILFERVSLRHRQKGADTEQLLQIVSFERTRLLSLINSMADAVIATTVTGRVVLYNGAALDLLNTNVSLDRKYLGDYLQLKRDDGKSFDLIKEAQKSGAVMKRDDLYFLSNEGQKVNIYIDISPIHTVVREGGGFIMLLRDITKEKSLDEERSEFISVTSHELRTPIAIAEANLSTALLPKLAADLPKNLIELLEQAHAQVIFLADLVNDLTTLARAERGDLAVEETAINPAQLLQELSENYQQEAEAKKLKVVLAPRTTRTTVNTSELYVREILQNFITNALKYTEKGQITLSAEATGEGGVIFSVKDSGIGISSSDKHKIFSKFYRAEDYRTRKTRGTGLGLYITLKLAERIGAKIWLESQLDHGSTFYLEVPPLGERHKDRVKGTRRFRSLLTEGTKS
ncbi:hypothetical protein HY346_01935 [Candidatus Microgenomates bacterium]|nr:hypothetical protein [Candidatus Microgenomates bacterium]